MLKFPLLNGVTVVILVTFGEIRLDFSVCNISKTIHGTLIHGQTSTKYPNLGFFRHPCPTLVSSAITIKRRSAITGYSPAYNFLFTPKDGKIISNFH